MPPARIITVQLRKICHPTEPLPAGAASGALPIGGTSPTIGATLLAGGVDDRTRERIAKGQVRGYVDHAKSVDVQRPVCPILSAYRPNPPLRYGDICVIGP